MAGAAPRLASIFVHPIKSCRGIARQSARVVRTGLDSDRIALLFEVDTGRFISQREEPTLARVAVRERDDGFELRIGESDSPTLTLKAPDPGSPRARVQVWGDHTEALVHPAGSDFFSELLGRPVRLGFLPEDGARPVDPRYARQGDVVGFADGYPLLATVRESLDELIRRAGTPLEMERFRPNVVIEGLDAFSEDGWTTLQIGPARFAAPKPCDRCVITTLDPRTGVAGKEPLRTLATFRRRERKTLFGVNLIPDRESIGMTLRVGDPVVVVQSSMGSGA